MSLYRRFRDRFGTAGVVLGVIALILALGGTAFAASGALTGKQKKEVEKIAKKYAGKPGADGATGPAGPKGDTGAQGPKGDTGAKGDKGDTGNTGTPGTPGTAGKSVSLTAEPEGANCKSGTGGGVKVEVQGEAASKKYVCNGSPWTAGGTLPSGATETGVWTATLETIDEFKPGALASTSFSIPLEAGGEAFVFTEGEVEEEEFGTSGCSGEFNLPEAPPGVLCVFTTSEQSNNHVSGPLFARTPSGGLERFAPTGAVLYGPTLTGTAEVPARMSYSGTWAVTAP